MLIYYVDIYVDKCWYMLYSKTIIRWVDFSDFFWDSEDIRTYKWWFLHDLANEESSSLKYLKIFELIGEFQLKIS